LKVSLLLEEKTTTSKNPHFFLGNCFINHPIFMFNGNIGMAERTSEPHNIFSVLVSMYFLLF